MSFTPEEITEILQAYFESIAHRQYTGSRYVPIFGRVGESSCDWDNTRDYEPLTIVLYQGNSYTSRQFVPAGADISNTDYWVLTGNFNAQVEQYRVRLVAMENALPIADFDGTNTIKKYIDDVAAVIPASSFDDTDTVKKYIDDSIAFDATKARVYNDVTEMIADTTLENGMICRTSGFHSTDDGGAAWYTISDTGTANGMDVILLNNNLLAVLQITEDSITPEMFGAYGDSVHDDSDSFTAMFNKIESIAVKPPSPSRYITKTIKLLKSYSLENYSIPDKHFHKIVIEGGLINGSITFPSNSFYNLTIKNTTFKNSFDDGYCLILEPNATVEYKTVVLEQCIFLSNGIKANTRSIDISINSCDFCGVDLAFEGLNIDKCTFRNCWFDTKTNKTDGHQYTVLMTGNLEGNLVFDSCIIVEATRNLGSFAYTAFVGTRSQVVFTNTRVSNEAGQDFRLVEFFSDTDEKLSTGHATGASFSDCELNCKYIVSLLGLPSYILAKNCIRSLERPFIVLDSNITNPYITRPGLIIDLRGNHFWQDMIYKKFGPGAPDKPVGVNASLEPLVPWTLGYAIQRGYYGQFTALIVPIQNGIASISTVGNTLDLFKVIQKGTAYNNNIHPVVMIVSYIAQTPSTDIYTKTIDIVYKTDSTVQKQNLFGASDTVYTLSSDNDEYTFTISNPTKRLWGIDFRQMQTGYIGEA